MLEFQQLVGYKFKNENLLKLALTHSSYAKEHGLNSYERLEFLGDAVLEFLVSDFVYKNMQLNPGEMTKLRAKLVDEETLSAVVDAMKIADYVCTGNALGGKLNKRIKCDVFESLLGAIYLDGGLEFAKEFVNNFLIKNVENLNALLGAVVDYKTELQETIKKQNSKNEIAYKLLKSLGPDHNKHFEFAVYLNGELLATGQGNSKKTAQNNAAKNAYLKLKK